jgi:hypothetical protein
MASGDVDPEHRIGALREHELERTVAAADAQHAAQAPAGRSGAQHARIALEAQAPAGRMVASFGVVAGEERALGLLDLADGQGGCRRVGLWFEIRHVSSSPVASAAGRGSPPGSAHAPARWRGA